LKKKIIGVTIAASLISAGCLAVAQTAIAVETASLKVVFSPDGGAEQPVLGAINAPSGRSG
jgi:hypothetical protein